MLTDELKQFIDLNLPTLAKDFAEDQSDYLIKDWKSGNIAEHPVIGDFIAYCHEAREDAEHGEEAKQQYIN